MQLTIILSERVIRDCVRVGFHCWVLQKAHVVLGYTIATISADECHILNLCISPKVRRCGYARRILCAILSAARASGANNAVLEVRRSNTGAQDLYAQYGFSKTGLRTEYYKDENGREDALVFGRQLVDIMT